MKKVKIICGPTAGGKTDYAMNLARENDGIIINADSRQIFRNIPIVSASPTEEMKFEIPHYLYNFLNDDDSYNVAEYIEDVGDVIKENTDKNIYIVGGTGMYIGALMNGLSSVPDISENLRSEVREYHEKVGNEVIYKELLELDLNSSHLNMNDTQRILRAYEVIKDTGKSLKYWQENTKSIPVLGNYEIDIDVIIPERKQLYDNCNKRFEMMINNGGIEEVSALSNPGSQISNAIGVRQILDYLDGNITRNEMIEDASIKTRQYAKRQVTWFRRYL